MKSATRKTITSTILLVLLGAGCDEPAAAPAPVEKRPAKPEPEPEPVVESPPHFVIGDESISVRSTSVEGGKKSGEIPTVEFDKLKTALADEKKFIDGQDLKVIVARKAKRGWVGSYLAELGKLGAKNVTIKTETRSEFPGEVEFVPMATSEDVLDCTFIGQVTEHNGSALWNVKGGTAKTRGPGLGGPDLSMAKEAIASNYEKCESNVFVTDGDEKKEWGFIYDMAAAAVSTPEAGVKRAILPLKSQTAGRKVDF